MLSQTNSFKDILSTFFDIKNFRTFKRSKKKKQRKKEKRAQQVENRRLVDFFPPIT